MRRKIVDGLTWLTLWGLAAVTVIFSIASLLRQLDLPEKQWWTDNAAWTSPALFALGVIVAIGGPLKLISLSDATKQSATKSNAEGYCQQLLIAVHLGLRRIPIEALTVHAWTVKRGHWWNGDVDCLYRLASFRVEHRKDSGVTFVKGKGAVGDCWATNLQIEADLSNLHLVAAGGRSAFEAIPAADRFNLSWEEYQNTKRYTSIFVTPLKDAKGNFIGCVSVDTTSSGHHDDFITACTRSDVEGLVSLMEKVIRGA